MFAHVKQPRHGHNYILNNYISAFNFNCLLSRTLSRQRELQLALTLLFFISEQLSMALK